MFKFEERARAVKFSGLMVRVYLAPERFRYATLCVSFERPFLGLGFTVLSLVFGIVKRRKGDKIPRSGAKRTSVDIQDIYRMIHST